jgi:hypothetical protein
VVLGKRSEADQAIKALHNQHVMPGMANAIQISYAKVRAAGSRSL